jgi:Spy/CpxP family protein refolding chaperone
VTKRLALLTAALAASLLAQPPHGGRGPGHMRPNHDEIKSYLNLSDSQLQALEQIQQQQMDSVRPLMQQIGQKHGALNDLIQKGGADPAAVGKLVLEIDALQKSIGQKRTSFADQARNTLTSDQKTRLKALDDTRKAMPAIEQGTALNLLAPQGPMHGPAMMGAPGGFAPDGFRRHGPMHQPPQPNPA